MTDLIENRQFTAKDESVGTTALDGAIPYTPALPAGTSTHRSTESSDEVATPWSLREPDDSTPSSPADRVESPALVDEIGGALDHRSTPDTPSPLEAELETTELQDQIKRIIVARTNLPDSVCGLLAFWAISTWFQEAFIVNPCLVITGPAHEGTVLLRVLHDLCRNPALLAGFKRADLKDINGYRTLLISEPNLDNRTAALLGNLTNRGFILLEQGSYLYCSGSRAIYIGEDPAVKRIQHSLCVDVTAHPHAGRPASGQWLPGKIDSLRNRILGYRDRNLAKVRSLEFNPHDLSPEAHAMANALGSCLIDAPQLQAELAGLFRPQDRQPIADRSDSVEALIAGSALTFCHQGKQQVFVKEIATEVNRLLKARGETTQFSPAKVGHRLKKVGLLTRRLSEAGNGFILDKATIIHIHEVAAAYRGEDAVQGDENLHCPLCQQNECVREVI
jgi:hypothetical protein